jgi:monofunctional biosynthetic peptidoglycan transglycosylase
VLDGVRYRGEALEATARAVRVRTGALGWLWGTAGVRSVDVVGVDIRLDIGQLRSSPASRSPDGGRMDWPVRVEDARLEVHDHGEVLATASADCIERDSRAWLVRGGSVSVGGSVDVGDALHAGGPADVGRANGVGGQGAVSDRLTLQDVAARVERDDFGWVVQQLRVGRGEVAIARRAGDSVAGALRERLHRLLGSGRGDDEAGSRWPANAEEVRSETLGAPEDVGAAGRGGTKRTAWQSRLLAGTPDDGASGSGDGEPERGGDTATADRSPALRPPRGASVHPTVGTGGTRGAFEDRRYASPHVELRRGEVAASDAGTVRLRAASAGAGGAHAPHAARPAGQPEAELDSPGTGEVRAEADRARPRVRLADGARVRVDDVDLWTRSAAGEREELLSDLSLVVEAESEGRLRTHGDGRASTGGEVRWDLEVETDALRARGMLIFHDLPLALVTPLLPEVPWFEAERGRLDADLRVEGDGLERVALEGRLALRDAALSSARIAPGPVRGISFVVRGKGVFVPARRRLEIEEGYVELGRALVTVQGAAEWASDHYLFDVTALLPPTGCGVAVDAIPRDLLAELHGFTITGQMSARARVLIDSRQLDASRVEVRVQDACEFVTVPAAADPRRFDGPFVHRVLEPDGTVFEMQTGPGTAAWVPIERVSPFLVHAVLAHEDGGFFRHHGFAPSEIQTALVRNLKAGRFVQGASTITMQLVKNVFLHREKTLARKVQEALLTWWIERVFDKRRILELYLNVIEYGPGIYGIRNASLHYFGREPAELSVAQAAFLAMILPNPKAFQEVYEAGTLPARFGERLRAFLRRMESKGRIDRIALDDGLAELDRFAFHRPGDEPPPPRRLVGSTQALPFATYPNDDEDWTGVDEETAREAQRWLYGDTVP